VFAVVTGRLDLDPDSAVFTKAPVRPVIVTTEAAPRERLVALGRVADIVVAGDTELDAPAALALLTARGLRRVHCEGGPHLFGTLLASDLVDEFSLTLGNTVEGGPAGRIVAGELPGPREFELASILRAEDTLLLRYLRKGSPRSI
jgi:riboflavin biosynthesis pyrimidine reductase